MIVPAFSGWLKVRGVPSVFEVAPIVDHPQSEILPALSFTDFRLRHSVSSRHSVGPAKPRKKRQGRKSVARLASASCEAPPRESVQKSAQHALFHTDNVIRNYN